MVLYGDGGVAQYIGDISITQYHQFSSHLQVVQCACSPCVHIHVHLAIRQGSPASWGIYQVVVLGSDVQGELYLLQIAEVNGTVDGQG